MIHLKLLKLMIVSIALCISNGLHYTYHMARLLIDLVFFTKPSATYVAMCTKMPIIPGHIVIVDRIPASLSNAVNKHPDWQPIYDLFDNLRRPGNSAGSILVRQMDIHITWSCEDHVTNESNNFRPLVETPGPNWTEITCYGKVYGNVINRSYMTIRDSKVEFINNFKTLVLGLMDVLYTSCMNMRRPEHHIELIRTLLSESKDALSFAETANFIEE